MATASSTVGGEGAKILLVEPAEESYSGREVLVVGAPESPDERRRLWLYAVALLAAILVGYGIWAWTHDTGPGHPVVVQSPPERLADVLYAEVHGLDVRSNGAGATADLAMSLGNSGHATIDVYSIALTKSTAHLMALRGLKAVVVRGVAELQEPVSIAPGMKIEMHLVVNLDSCRSAVSDPGMLRVRGGRGRGALLDVTVRPSATGAESWLVGPGCGQ